MKALTISELSSRLAERAEDLAPILLPAGKRINGDWVAGNVFGDPGDSLKVNLHGPHQGKWRDWANDSDHGDLLDLWRIAKGITAPQAVDEAREYLGLPKPPQTLAKRSYGACPDRPSVQPVSPNGIAIKWLMEERRLNADVIQKFKIQGCKEHKAVVFPSYSPSGELVNRSYRTLADKKIWQEKGAAPCLFGWHALPEEAFRSRTVILCEGQIDAMTWAQWGFAALSIPNGSGQAWIEYEWDNLQVFDTILISFDQDRAGKENLRKTIARLGPSRCLIISLPHKDANDCLKKGMTSGDALNLIQTAKPPKVDRMVTADEMRERVTAALANRFQKAFTLPFLEGKTNADGFYFRPGEVTLWTGPTSAGKSTMLNYVILFLISAKTPVYMASMEMRAEDVILKMLVTMLGGDPRPEQIEKLCSHYGSLVAMADITGYIDQKELFDQMRFCFQRYGTQHFFIDSLMRVSGLEEEYDKQGQFLNELQEFAKGCDVHVHLVTHSRKIQEGARATKQDIKGSSLIANNADNILSLRRNMEKKAAMEDGKDVSSMHDADLSVEKQRATGWEGVVRLRFDPVLCAYSKMP